MALKRTAVTTLLTAAQLYMTWVACIRNNHFAWNVVVFLLWTCFVIGCMAVALAACSPDYKRITRPASLAKISLITDIAQAVFLAAFGHFFYASLILVTQLLENVFYETAKPAEKEKAA